TLIRFQFDNNITNHSEIEQKFREIIVLINEIGADNENQYELYRYKYHTTYNSYLNAIGDVEGANRQEILARRYERHRIEEIQPVLYVDFVESVAVNQDCHLKDKILEKLNKIRSILEDELIDINVVNTLISEIKQIFENFDRITETFEGYQEAINCEIYMHRLANSLINKKLITLKANDNNEGLKSSKIQTVSKELIDYLRCLELFAHDVAYSKRIEFISFLSNSSDKIEILFKNIINTEEGIKRRARVLNSFFHPDRTKHLNSPYVLQEKHKSQGDELFKLILTFKEHLLNKLKKTLELEDYEKYGNELWKTAIDYNNASKGKWNKLKILKKDDIKELSSELLKHNSITMGELAYHQYRAACKVADRAKLLKKQVKLRGYMALCLYFTDKFLEARLYALVAIILHLKSLSNFTQELDEAKNILDKVNRRKKEGEKSEKGLSSNSNTDIKFVCDPNHAMALIRTNGSFYNRGIIQNSINKSLFNIATNLFIKTEHQTLYNEIFRVKLAKTYLGAILFKKSIIREKLNEIINRALSAYDNGKYQEFINVLSEEYDENKRLLEYYNNLGILEIDIIGTLKKHGFRPDGIAYLLVVLGEVLGSGNIKIKGVPHIFLKADAKKFFQLALSSELVKEAKELDKCTSKLRQTSRGSLERYFKSTYGTIKDFTLSEERTRLALEYLPDSLEMPFFSRLEEIRNFARINIAILNIINYDYDTLKEAIKPVEDTRHSVRENYQFVSKANLRLEVLEDFLWIISDEDLSDVSDVSLLITFPVATNSVPEPDDKYINYLSGQNSFNQGSKYYEAAYFEHLAEKEAKFNKLNSLRYWQSAQENYNIARKINPDNPIYSIGYAKCLLKLSKYTQVIKLSDICPALNSSSEYWHFRSVAYFKQKKYIDAMSCNSEALTLDPGNNSAAKHRELVKKLIINNIVEHKIDRYKKKLIYETDYLKNSHNNEHTVYNILSIDGGGIRGVLPALWLSEIEYRTRRPISHLFNMIAGTSTSGIIAAGLSAPQFKCKKITDDYFEYEYSDLIPRFSASDLLNIYKNESKNLFTTSTSWFNIPIWSKAYDKYTNEGRSTIFKRYFEETRINQSLTELVIPAANENYTHLFTRYDAYKNSRNIEINNTFVDILMATTAAPTFFPPYKIGNKTFIDGGIYLNNPASAAYSEAIKHNVPEKNISVLSLGTGCYLTDPSNPPQSMISAQESNTDREMYNNLKNRYQRWQVFFEEPIGFDDHKSIPDLLELGYQYIEELDCSDENPINKLVESFNR
ncbi:13780_t:CDS:1, partial [Cetraspora pellucida]